MESGSLKVFIEMVSTVVAVLALVKGVIEFVRLNAIRRYEKFHEMSVRFDENADIQKVCTVLEGSDNVEGALRMHEKEVFICFLEEIYFMMNSGIMKRDLALYTFGYYGRLAVESTEFCQGLSRGEAFHTQFLEFCSLAKAFRPTPDARRGALVY
jgi:hypothetical protein